MSESDWVAGNRAAWRRLLGECLLELGEADHPDAHGAHAVAQLEDVRIQMRDLFNGLGIEWRDNVALCDLLRRDLEHYLLEKGLL